MRARCVQKGERVKRVCPEDSASPCPLPSSPSLSRRSAASAAGPARRIVYCTVLQPASAPSRLALRARRALSRCADRRPVVARPSCPPPPVPQLHLALSAGARGGDCIVPSSIGTAPGGPGEFHSADRRRRRRRRPVRFNSTFFGVLSATQHPHSWLSLSPRLRSIAWLLPARSVPGVEGDRERAATSSWRVSTGEID